jgi:hypothetical protein
MSWEPPSLVQGLIHHDVGLARRRGALGARPTRTGTTGTGVDPIGSQLDVMLVSLAFRILFPFLELGRSANQERLLRLSHATTDWRG